VALTSEPGFKSVRIEPHFGNLQFIEATMSVKLGTLKLNYKRNQENHLHGEIILPDKLTGIYIWNGERKYYYGGINIIN